MVYSYTSSKEVIGRVEHDLTIDFSDWIPRAPLWIADGLAQVNAVGYLEDAHEAVTVSDYRGKLPCNNKVLIAIDYEGYRMSCIAKVASPFYERTSLFNSKETYELTGGDFFITSFEEGEVTVLFKRPPIEYWQEHNIYLPRVPDDENMLEALKWWIMLKILQKGTKHPTFNLRDNNMYINPGLAFEYYAKKARNSMGQMTSDQREELSTMLRTFLNNANKHYTINYKQEHL